MCGSLFQGSRTCCTSGLNFLAEQGQAFLQAMSAYTSRKRRAFPVKDLGSKAANKPPACHSQPSEAVQMSRGNGVAAQRVATHMMAQCPGPMLRA